MTGSIDSLPPAEGALWEARLRHFEIDEVEVESAFGQIADGAEMSEVDLDIDTEESRVDARRREHALNEQVAGDLEQSVAQRKEPLLRLEKAGEKLKANRLDELSEDDVRAIDESNEILDGLEPLDHLELDVSTGVGFESFPLSQLAPLAEKLGHPLMREGKPDFEKLAELKPDANYKLSPLQDAAEEFLGRANQDRLRSGSDLFEKALLDSGGDFDRNQWAG